MNAGMMVGPIARLVMGSIMGSRDFADRDGALMIDERNYVIDIADRLGASAGKAMRASVNDTMVRAGVAHGALYIGQDDEGFACYRVSGGFF